MQVKWPREGSGAIRSSFDRRNRLDKHVLDPDAGAILENNQPGHNDSIREHCPEFEDLSSKRVISRREPMRRCGLARCHPCRLRRRICAVDGLLDGASRVE